MSDELDPKWGRPVYERHLDLILAEEIECNAAFTRWLLETCRLAEIVPSEPPSGVSVQISVYDGSEDDTSSAGEDDLKVQLEWKEAGLRAVILIEDKLDAPLQPNQAARYVGRLENHRSKGAIAAAAVVAPEGYLNAKADDLGGLVPISIEQIVEQLDAQAATASNELKPRLTWRAANLKTMKESRRQPAREDQATVDFCGYLTYRLREADGAIEPAVSSMRTANTTWLYFNQPNALVFKWSHGVVDIYLRDLFPGDADEQLRRWISDPSLKGFEPARDSKQNLILRWGQLAKPTKLLRALWPAPNAEEER